MYRTLIASAGAVVFAASASAGTLFTAKLDSPVEKAEKIVAANVVWDCRDDTCVAELSRKTATVRTCKKVAKEIGKVSVFGSENGNLSDEDLAACNKSAK